MEYINNKKFLLVLFFSVLALLILIYYSFSRNLINFSYEKNNKVINENSILNIYEENNNQNNIEAGSLFKYNNNDYKDKTLIRSINQNELNIINTILSKNDEKTVLIEYTKLPDYILELDKEENSEISFRFNNILNNLIVNISSSTVIEIYDKKDIITVSGILGKEYNLPKYKDIDFTTLSEPPTLYINNKFELAKFTYSWYNNNSKFACGNTTFKEILVNTENVTSALSLKLSLNSDIYSKDLYKFPDNIKVRYRTYKYDENEYFTTKCIVTPKDAIRTLTGDFYIEKPSDTLETYVYNITVYDKNNDKIFSNYYFKFVQ